MYVYLGKLTEIKDSDQWAEHAGKLQQQKIARFAHDWQHKERAYHDQVTCTLLPASLVDAQIGDDFRLILDMRSSGSFSVISCENFTARQRRFEAELAGFFAPLTDAASLLLGALRGTQAGRDGDDLAKVRGDEKRSSAPPATPSEDMENRR